jgi:multisubunit Na+/H+ antiporter MnhB subunit
MGKRFTYGFFAGLVAVIVVVLMVFLFISSKDLEESVKMTLWAVVIFLFLLLGIILVSLLINRMRRDIAD